MNVMMIMMLNVTFRALHCILLRMQAHVEASFVKKREKKKTLNNFTKKYF